MTVRSATTTAPPRPAEPVRIPTRAPRHPRPPAVDPGTLPQTEQLPSAHTAQFRREMDGLWEGIRRGSLAPALPAFFPRAAYAQVKAIGDPDADWTYRLLADYKLDMLAARELLGPDPSAARLVGVTVPSGYAHWIPPGVCYNGVGYYELPNARVVYRAGGEERSFGIASMISWRGVWYVVHLGAVSRSAGVGIVDDPETGPGSSVASSTC